MKEEIRMKFNVLEKLMDVYTKIIGKLVYKEASQRDANNLKRRDMILHSGEFIRLNLSPAEFHTVRKYYMTEFNKNALELYKKVCYPDIDADVTSVIKELVQKTCIEYISKLGRLTLRTEQDEINAIAEIMTKIDYAVEFLVINDLLENECNLSHRYLIPIYKKSMRNVIREQYSADCTIMEASMALNTLNTIGGYVTTGLGLGSNGETEFQYWFYETRDVNYQFTLGISLLTAFVHLFVSYICLLRKIVNPTSITILVLGGIWILIGIIGYLTYRRFQNNYKGINDIYNIEYPIIEKRFTEKIKEHINYVQKDLEED